MGRFKENILARLVLLLVMWLSLLLIWQLADANFRIKEIENKIENKQQPS